MRKISIILLACFFAMGCNKFGDMNINPNLPSQASGTQLIANAALSLPGLSSSPSGVFAAQYLSETQYPGASLYPEGGTSFYGLYQGPLMNLETVIKSTTLSATEGPVVNQVAVAKILKAYFLWHATDRWGDLPMSEAFLGSEDFTPKYDTQAEIYNALFTLLDEANTAIVTGNLTNEIIYGGDVAKWKKLGNTIRLLMALRLSKIDATKGALEFNKALTQGVMTANADNLVFKHLADANNQNYWYGQVENQNRKWWALSSLLVNIMKPVNDPRLPIYGQPATTGGQFTGLPFGTIAGMPNTTNYSLMGTAIYAQNAPVSLVTYAQLLFAKAEAAKLGWITGGDTDAKINYDLALEQSVRQWKNNDTSGLGVMRLSAAVAYAPTTALEQIATQRWVHLFMHGYEGWAEWRRTGYPALASPVGEPTRAVPRRNAYPATELFNNTDNYKEAIQRQFAGADLITGRVWWDKP
ncbi:MAG: SusD/RagB family nutrient-binding outer membrane lipoprotein [Sphingobacteriales bacterium]|nr:MAG: SusD/RagB family nutrient-binding outer membrane lipoprotein [Sphingobacteriales bacterium]